jgi:filamentous hemagglutinin family protein
MNRHASINRVYRLIWSAVRGVWIPAAENSRGRGKRVSRTLAAAALALGGAYAQAGAPPTGPSGGVITAGSGSIAQAGALTTITQASPHLSLTWNSFNIPVQDTVDFVQPSASAIAVNRILDVNGTQILGHLNANGQVYLINLDGIVFGPGAEVNVGGLVASTLALDATDVPGNAQSFSAAFSGDGTGSVINNGTIHAASGGYVALLAQRVGNSGIVSAQLGTVALGAGSAATLKFKGTHLVSMQIDQSVLASVADNGGLIRADGGQVLMSAGAEKALLASVVNNTGVIEARTLDHQQGSIILRGGMVAGTVTVAGTLDASAPDGGNGGAIQTSAAHVEIADSAHVTTAAAMGLAGSWLIDPTDFTIAASGGDESGATLSAALANGNVAIASSAGATGTSGDINVNDTVTWSANTLTLSAQNNININSAMNGSGTANLALQYGQGAVAAGNLSTYVVNAPVNLPAGLHFSTLLGSDGAVVNYTVITALGAAVDATTAPATATLQGIAAPTNLAGNFALGGNIDASATAGWNPCGGCTAGGGGGNYGFTPIGSTGPAFSGRFDGLGHSISNLTINQVGGSIGLFGTVAVAGSVSNIGLVGVSTYGPASMGALIGTNQGAVTNSYATGSVASVSGSSYIGGLVGGNSGTISNSYSTVSVSAAESSHVGGLVGINSGAITSSYATGAVMGYAQTGGLAGINTGSISNSYAGGAVSGMSIAIGGLVGQNSGAISASHATGYVYGAFSSSNDTGGLVGLNTSSGTIDSSYAENDVNGTTPGTGGLVGINYGLISNSYTAGSHTVTGGIDAGGLVGTNHGVISQSYATDNASGNYVGGLVGNNYGGSITESYATGTVSGTYGIGGLVGNSTGSITKSYATGIVSGTYGIGGLVGFSSGSISNSYATGAVSGQYQTGGLVGVNNSAISNSYATGVVTGSTSSYIGTVVGANYGTLTNTFYNSSVNTGLTGIGATSGTLADVAGSVVGLTTAQLQTQANFTAATVANGNALSNWDFAGTWFMYQGLTAPLLRSFMTPLTVSAVATRIYNAMAFVPGTSDLTYSTVPDTSQLFGAATFSGTAVGAVHAGSYTLTPAGFYSDQQGYIITYGTGTVTITRAPLSVAGTPVANKVYDGTTVATLTGGTLVGVIGSDSVTLIGSGTYASKNAGSGIAVTATYSLGGANDGDYSLSSQPSDSLTGTITPALLTVSGTTVGTRSYNGTLGAPLSGGALLGVVPGDVVTLTQAGAFASKNPGSALAVTAEDSLGGASASDYVLTEPTGLTGVISPASLTVSGTVVGNKIFNGNTSAPLIDGTLSGVIPGDSVTLVQGGNFASASVGAGIAVTAADGLAGPSAIDYSIIQPTGLTGTISPASSGNTPGTPGTSGGSSSPLLAAYNASAQIDANSLAPQWGATPQVIDASSSIDVVETASEPASTDAGVDQDSTSSSTGGGVVINVAMKIGATGTLKVESGGLRLPVTHVQGNP